MNLKRKAMLSLSVMSLVVLIVTGTFAWTNLGSQRVNEWHGTGKSGNTSVAGNKVGGTLHNDHMENEESKQVYIENWGIEDLFVRIKLTEYMEVGEGAGLKSVSKDQTTSAPIPNPQNLSKPVVEGSSIDLLNTWASVWHRFPESDDLPTELEPQNLLRNYWDWQTGGNKYYYPAPEGSREDYNYVDTNSPDDLEADSQNANGVIAKQTLNATVLTMTEWKASGSPIGDYWVIDRPDTGNCWAYWAAPLKPGEATGLLINKVSLSSNAGYYTEYFDLSDGYYYGINVEAQMATKDGEADSDGLIDNYKKFESNGGWSTDGEALMEKIVNEINTDVSDKSAIEAAIEDANEFLGRNLSAFTEDSATEAKDWIAAKLDELEELLANEDISQIELDLMLSKINIPANIEYAESLLVYKPSSLDKSALQAAIDDADDFKASDFSDYTDDSAEIAKNWISSKLGELEELLEDESITQTDLDMRLKQVNISANIEYAEGLLVLKSSSEEGSSEVEPSEVEPSVGKSAVEAAIEDVNEFLARDFTDFTEESVENAINWVTAKSEELESLLSAVDSISQVEATNLLNLINISANIEYAESLLELKTA